MCLTLVYSLIATYACTLLQNFSIWLHCWSNILKHCKLIDFSWALNLPHTLKNRYLDNQQYHQKIKSYRLYKKYRHQKTQTPGLFRKKMQKNQRQIMIEKLIIQFWSTIWKYYAKAGLWPVRPCRQNRWAGIHFKRVHFGIFSGAPPNIFLPQIWGLYFDLRSRQTRFLSLIQRSYYTKVLLYLNHICPRLLEHIHSERGGGGGWHICPPYVFRGWFGLGFQTFLEIVWELITILKKIREFWQIGLKQCKRS